MGVYSLDRSSPKKHGVPRSAFSELRRKLMTRRYICLWVLLALVPCYLLRQMFFYQSSTAAAYARNPTDEVMTTSSISSSSKTVHHPIVKPTDAYVKPVEVDGTLTELEEQPAEVKAVEEKEKPVKKEKSVLDYIFKPISIKPAKYDTGSATVPQSKKNATRNSLQLKLKDNFADDDEDFGVAEDNDKAEEQMWTAPPAPPSQPKENTKEKTILER